jgi:hypothetical protein
MQMAWQRQRAPKALQVGGVLHCRPLLRQLLRVVRTMMKRFQKPGLLWQERGVLVCGQGGQVQRPLAPAVHLLQFKMQGL